MNNFLYYLVSLVVVVVFERAHSKFRRPMAPETSGQALPRCHLYELDWLHLPLAASAARSSSSIASPARSSPERSGHNDKAPTSALWLLWVTLALVKF